MCNSICTCVMKCVCVCALGVSLCHEVSISVPLRPKKSRVVEAICILLYHKYTNAQLSSGAGKITGLQLLM